MRLARVAGVGLLALLGTTCEAPPGEPPPVPRSCAPFDASKAQGTVKLTRVLTGTPDGLLEKPTDMKVLPDGRVFVTTQAGRIFTAPSVEESAELTLWLDISERVESRDACCKEEGMYSVAFHPSFADNGELFVIYTQRTVIYASDTVVSRFVVEDPANGAPDPDGEEVLIRVQQPSVVHNGGQMRFGPDGYLYIGFGDGGGGGDPQQNGQNRGTIFGSIVRIDVDSTDGDLPYGIPPDNPFVGVEGAAPEIWGYGFRNPWRIAFDPVTGDLWAGDVGEVTWEEINEVERGGNHGWSNMEGPLCRHPDPEIGCDPDDYVAPAHAYNHDTGKSVTLGIVYDGTAMPWLRGTVLFADFAIGTLWSLKADGDEYQAEELMQTGLRVATFSVDRDGEPYLLDHGEGMIYRLDPGDGDREGDSPWPPRLSDTGCFESIGERRFAPEVFAYEVNSPLWSDGADKARGIVLPEGTSVARPDDPYAPWSFPVGTIAIKTFELGGEPLETRFLVRADQSRWMGATYRWNQEGTEAVLLDDRETQGAPSWVYPSRSDCLACHTRAAGQLLGFRTAQVHRIDDDLDQLAAMARFGYLANPPEDGETPPSYPSIDDDDASVEARARAYLAVNCAQCHRPGGPTPTALDLRYGVALADTGACDAPPGRGDLGLEDARIVAPGDPDRSVLLARMRSTDPVEMMPPLARQRVDDAAVAPIAEWVASLSGCD